MSTLAAVATVALTLLVTFGPGLAGGLLLGLRGLAAWALAPVLSVALLGLEGVAAQLAGLRWSSWWYAAASLLVAVAAFGAGRALQGSGPDADPRPAGRLAALGVLLGSGTVVAGFAAAMSTVRAVPAQPDATYHLNLIRWMLNTGDVSSRDGGVFLYDRPHSFYPATFHAIAATVGDVVHQQPVVLANTLAVVAAAPIWVGGCVLFCRQAFGCVTRLLVFAGVAGGAFTAMPYWMGGYGVLWPYLLGMALVPGLLGCGLSIVGLARDDVIGRSRAAVVLVIGAAGLGLVHPHAVSSLAVVLAVVAATAAVQWAAARRTWGATVLAVAAVAGPVLLWVLASRTAKIRAMSAAYALGPEESVRHAGYEALVNGPRYSQPLWVTSAIVLIGVVVCTWRPATRWVTVTWLATCAIFVAVVGVQSAQTRALTVFWYNNNPRLAALVPVATVPALTAGLGALSTWVESAVRRQEFRQTARGATALVLVVYLAATLGNNHGAHVDRLRPYYHPDDPDTALLTLQEATAMRALARSIPSGAVVADNPWRGHALLYALTSRQVAFYSEKAVTTPDRELVADHLADAATDPQVCAAVRAMHVTYAITGGTNELEHHNGRSAFAGVDRVPGQAGFEQVATVAPYTLWRVTACQ